MKQCKACKSEIDSKATKCSKCGSDQRNWFRKHPILTVILALFVIGMIGSSKGGSKTENSTELTNTQKSQATQQPAEQAITVDAKVLVGEFDKNKLAAQDKYTGKIVKTTAFIKNISSDILGSYYLSLNPVNDQYYFGTSIQCYFVSKDELVSLENGQKITVQGKMQDMSIGIVQMKECSVVK
jgi:hypothetical protein